MNIEIYRNNPDFIKDTALQIAKDFKLCNIQITVDSDAEDLYYELFKQIKPEIEDLMRNDFGHFRELLYRIDVNEKKLNRVLGLASKEEEINEITHLIIERELLKVATRHVFSGKKLK